MRATSFNYIWAGAAWAILTHLVSCQLTSLPACGEDCISNMLGQAESLGCPNLPNNTPNGTCLCGNANFGYGIRDCTLEACEAADFNTVITYMLGYCESAVSSSTILGTSLAGVNALTGTAAGPTTTTAGRPTTTTAPRPTTTTAPKPTTTTAPRPPTTTAPRPPTIYTVLTTTETAVLPTNVSLLTTTTVIFTSSITNKAQFSSLQSKDQSTVSMHTETPVSSAVPASSRLSNGAKAGIGVGVALGTLLIVGGVLCFVVVSRRKKKQEKAAVAESAVSETQELDGKRLPLTGGRSELEENRAPVELSANGSTVRRNRSPGELEGRPVANLDNNRSTEL